MGQRRPSVCEGQLHLYHGDAAVTGTIKLGSVAWHRWLDEHSVFLFEIPLMHFTARKEKRSGGWYWYAYRRHQGKLRTAYIGKSEELTLERLKEVADLLQGIDNPAECGIDSAERGKDPSGIPHSAFRIPHSGAPPPPLPIPLTPLVGREQDVAAVTALLARPDVRLVSLVGTGGVGKTRLALQIAAEMREQFADGVYFVTLTPIRDPQLALSTISQVLGLKEEPNVSLADLVIEFLRDRHLLLVLDNFEQVMPAASLLVDLLTTCSRLKILVTSREIMHICSEHHFPVAPLAFPDLEHLPSPDLLAGYPAVSLYLQRAHVIIPDMATNPATILAIARVCARLEGLPLAIELAAARVRLLPPQALAARLGRRLDVLPEGGPDMPARHKTLRATFDWSRDLLTEEEQRVFRRLSIFVDGCPLEAAEAVCSVFGDLTGNFLNAVSSLVDKSLVQTISHEGQEPRLHLLETVREYALECLLENGEMERMQQAHAAYYVSFAEQAEPELHSHKQYLWLDRLDADNENLRAALSFLLSSHDRERAVRLAGALGWFWYIRGRLSEGLDWTEQTLSECGLQNAECGIHVSYIPHSASPFFVLLIPPSARALFFAAGLFAEYLGQRERARMWMKASLVLSNRAEDMRGVAKAAFELAQVYLVDGDVAAAQALAEEALSFVQGTEDAWTLATVLNLLGLVTMCLGDLLGAGVLCERSVALFAEAGDFYMRDQVLLMVGNALLAQGDETGARNLIEDLIDGSDAGHSFWMAGWVLCAYGEIALQQGDGSRARFLLEQALAQSSRVGNRAGMARAYSLLAQVALAAHNLSSARASAAQSLQIAESVGDKETIISCLEGIADIAARNGQIAWATRLWGAAERQREAARKEPAAAEQKSRKPLVETACSAVGRQLFDEMWAEGRSLTPEEALNNRGMWNVECGMTSIIPHSTFHIPHSTPRPAGLTKREMEALLLVAEGFSNNQIADHLVVSTATVKTYLSAVYNKLGVSSRTAAMRYAIDHRLHTTSTFANSR